MLFERDRDRWAFHLGDFTDPDDPRGREFVASVLIGVPTGEFTTPVGPVQPNGRRARRIRGTWAAWVMLWRWGIRIAVAGPIVGHYPDTED